MQNSKQSSTLGRILGKILSCLLTLFFVMPMALLVFTIVLMLGGLLFLAAYLICTYLEIYLSPDYILVALCCSAIFATIISLGYIAWAMFNTWRDL